MAFIQQINGDYYGSKETVTEGLIYAKDKDHIGSINNILGIADKELSLYDDAIYYYKKAADQYTDSIYKQYPIQNIAAVYIQQKNMTKQFLFLNLF